MILNKTANTYKLNAFNEALNKLAKQSLINGTAHFEKCKQLFEYQHLLLVRDI